MTMPHPVQTNEDLKSATAKDKLCREVSSILDQLTPDSFSKFLSKILELQLNGTNIMAFQKLMQTRLV